jgi:hypothetical protein
VVLAAGVLDGEVASMSNILEQEDIVKGLPDATLDSEMQQPSGQIPQFLILSEIHRRTEMRNNFAANEDDFSTPVVEQMLAASSASRQGLGTPMAQPSAIGQPELSAMAQASPVPSMPSPSPAIPVGGVPQGLGGMGVQLASTGGVVGMAEAGQVPTSLKALRNGEAVVLARGENPDDFSVADLEYIGRTSPNQLGVMSNFMGKNHPALGFGRYQSPVAELDASPLDTPPLDYNEVLSGQSLSPEIAYEQRSGRDIDAPSVWDDAALAMERDKNKENYPFTFMSEEDRARMPFGDKVVGDVREGGERVFEYVKNYVPAAGRRLFDMATVGLSGDPRNPELVREEAGQSVEEAFTGGRDAIERQLDAAKIYAKESVGNMMESGQELLGADQAAEERQLDAAKIYAKGMFPDPVELTSEEIIEAATNQSLFEKTGIDLSEYEMDDQYFGEVVETEPAGFWETLKKDFLTDDVKETMSGWLEKAHDWRDAGTPNPNTHHIPTDPEVVTDIAQGVEDTGSLKRDLLRQDGGFNTNQEFINSMAPYSASATGTETDTMGLLLDEFGVFEDAQGESAENLRSLIENNRAESKNRAFYLGMAALGAGIAKGEMGEGMENAVAIASDTLAKGESAVAPLEAASATEKSQSSKDRFEALVGLARADANFQAVQAQLVREGGLNARNYNTLKVAVMRAVQGILDSGVVEGTDTAAGAATVFNEMVNMMMGDVGSIEDAQAQLTTNPLTDRLQFTVPPA